MIVDLVIAGDLKNKVSSIFIIEFREFTQLHDCYNPSSVVGNYSRQVNEFSDFLKLNSGTSISYHH